MNLPLQLQYPERTLDLTPARDETARQDSFSGAERLVEGPQYTRPREFRGLHVPEVLLSGDHRRIAAWRHEQAVDATRRRTQPTTQPQRSLP